MRQLISVKYLFMKHGENNESYCFFSTEAHFSNLDVPHLVLYYYYYFRTIFVNKSHQITANQAGPDDLTVPGWFATSCQKNF